MTPWLTTREVGLLLDLSDDTIRRMCERGKFPGAEQYGVGAKWRIPREAVDHARQRARDSVMPHRRAAR